MERELVLIVEDNPQNLKLARVVMEGAGYAVEAATTAEEALRVLDSLHPRLVLMDIQLPGLDGLELARRLKADPRRSDIVILALTAYAMKGDREKALAAGCDGYLTKPFDTLELAEVVAQLLAAARPAGA